MMCGKDRRRKGTNFDYKGKNRRKKVKPAHSRKTFGEKIKRRIVLIKTKDKAKMKHMNKTANSDSNLQGNQ